MQQRGQPRLLRLTACQLSNSGMFGVGWGAREENMTFADFRREFEVEL